MGTVCEIVNAEGTSTVENKVPRVAGETDSRIGAVLAVG